MRAAGGEPATFSPVGFSRLLEGPIDPQLFQGCVVATQVLALAFAAGLWYRVLAPLFAFLFFFVLSYSNSWSMVYHTENMLILHVVVLAFSPAAAALSLDSWDRSERPQTWWAKLENLVSARPDTESRWVYGWVIVMMQLVATLPYVVAGIAKINGKSGWSWALGHNLRDQITMNGLYYEMLRGGTGEITFHVYGYETAFAVAATLTLILELGAPFAILHRYAGYLYVVSIMGMHWSILFIMGIPFPYQLYGAAFACFFEWERLVVHLRTWFKRFEKPVGA